MKLGAAVLLLASVAACRDKAPAPTVSRDKPPAPASRAESAPPSTDEPCRDIPRLFKEALAEGGRCAKDDDCRCYTAEVLDCGGVTDRKTQGRVSTLLRLFRLAGCPSPAKARRCAERPPCKATCVGGRCVSSARAALNCPSPRAPPQALP